MAIKALTNVAVGTTATLIYSAKNSDDGADCVIRNTGTVDVRVGGADVTATDKGFLLQKGATAPAGDSVRLSLALNDELYAVCAGGGTVDFIGSRT
jgi:hypothetical protein